MYIQGNQYPSDFEAKKQMIEIGKDAGDRDWCIPGDGSISTRVGPNAVWITIQGADLHHLTQDSFLRVDLTGRQMIANRQKQPACDAAAHLAVYANNEKVRCVIHTYPPLLVARALKGSGISGAGFTPALRQLGSIPLVQAKNPDELARQTAQAAGSGNGLLISGDGCMTWADSPKKAYQMTQAANYVEQVRQAGGCCASGKCAACAFRESAVPPAYCDQANAENARKPQEAVPAYTAGTDSGKSETGGITPVIRPGDANAFKLPDGASSKQAPAPVTRTAISPIRPAAAENSQYRAHPVTSSAPSNASFLKNTYTPVHAGGTGTVRPVTVGTVPKNYTIRGGESAGIGTKTVRPSLRFGKENQSVIGTTGRFYGYSYGSGNENRQSTATQAAPVHGTEAATAQCPVNVAANDPQIPYKRADGPVKNAPKQEIMAEVVRRAINSMK